MKTKALILASLITTVLAAPAATAATTASGDYLAAGGDAVVACEAEDILDACIGGQVFDAADTDTVSITVDDDNTANAAAFYQFADADGNTLGSQAFCGATDQPVPADAATLYVYVSTALAPLDCPEDPGAIGTTGTIAVAWS